MNEEFFISLKKRIKPYFESSGGHDFFHTERVYNNALAISKNEKVDMDVIKISCLLHDIARLDEEKDKSICHAKKGAERARKILKEFKLPEEKIENICYCIKSHRYRNKIKAKTKEAQILQDADRLDSIGAINIARVFNFGGVNQIPMHNPHKKPLKNYSKSETSLNHFYEKILKISPNSFNTSEAKKIAKNRYIYTKKFINQFMDEWKGIK